MGNQSLRSCLPHVLSLISPAMAPRPQTRPVRRPNMSDSPAQKLPVTHSRVHSPQQLAFSILTCYSHRSTAQVRQERSDAHKLISLSHPFTMRHGCSRTRRALSSCWTMGGLWWRWECWPGAPVITTFYLSADRRLGSTGRLPASEDHLLRTGRPS